MSPSEKYCALKGVQDIFPPAVYAWQKVEELSKEVFSVYGFQEIRPPIIESTGLFMRSIGETTDIVEKEMYTFEDRAGRSITLRPEGTASVVRAYVEHHLYNMPSPQKFFYSGPMFRYERPQKGRSRQFYQIGAEAFGSASSSLDLEILLMVRTFLERLGLKELKLEINSIGCEECRPSYRKALTDFFSGRVDELCPDCKRRYEHNPLRILDCKVERCIELKSGAPAVADFLCDDCREHFDSLISGLKFFDVQYVINPNMVRGLDYYTRTTFEITTGRLGAQNAVAAGGRYDRLVEEFGGPATPAVGFAMGMERLTSLLAGEGEVAVPAPDVFIATLGADSVAAGLSIAERLRSRSLWAEVGYDGSSLKSQLRRADRLSSHYAIIIGDNELSSGKIKWKNLRDSSQGEVELKKIDEFLSTVLPVKGADEYGPFGVIIISKACFLEAVENYRFLFLDRVPYDLVVPGYLLITAPLPPEAPGIESPALFVKKHDGRCPHTNRIDRHFDYLFGNLVDAHAGKRVQEFIKKGELFVSIAELPDSEFEVLGHAVDFCARH